MIFSLTFTFMNEILRQTHCRFNVILPFVSNLHITNVQTNQLSPTTSRHPPKHLIYVQFSCKKNPKRMHPHYCPINQTSCRSAHRGARCLPVTVLAYRDAEALCCWKRLSWILVSPWISVLDAAAAEAENTEKTKEPCKQRLSSSAPASSLSLLLSLYVFNARLSLGEHGSCSSPELQ